MRSLAATALTGLLPSLATAYSIGWGNWDELDTINYSPVPPTADPSNPPCNVIPNPPGDTLEIFVRAGYIDTPVPPYIAIYGAPATADAACSFGTLQAIYSFDTQAYDRMQGAWVSSYDTARWQEVYPNAEPLTAVKELIQYLALMPGDVAVPTPEASGPVKWGRSDRSVFNAPWDYVPVSSVTSFGDAADQADQGGMIEEMAAPGYAGMIGGYSGPGNQMGMQPANGNMMGNMGGYGAGADGGWQNGQAGVQWSDGMDEELDFSIGTGEPYFESGSYQNSNPFNQ
ncbi:hypothetical protein ABW21_db0202262 [Orbilia brochopaga]|nr:hypothetical protein ABW21_db0202262 [Drechslerella brochopaga]